MSPKFLGCENSRKMKPFTKGVSVGGDKTPEKEPACGEIRVSFWTR